MAYQNNSYTSPLQIFFKTRRLYGAQCTIGKVLVHKFKVDFLPFDYDNSLQEEIKSWSHAKDEKVVTYIVIMKNLFNILSKPSAEEVKVQIFMKNLQPYLTEKMLFFHIHRLQDLKTAQPHNRAGEESKIEVFEPPQSSKAKQTAVMNQTQTFWNCDEPGYTFDKCKKPCTRFCYKCGLKNVIVRICLQCHENRKIQNAQETNDASVVTKTRSPDPEWDECLQLVRTFCKFPRVASFVTINFFSERLSSWVMNSQHQWTPDQKFPSWAI